MSWANNILRQLFATEKKETVSWKEKYEFKGNLEEYEPEDLHSFASFMIEPDMWFFNQYEAVALNTPQSQGIVLKSSDREDYLFFENFMQFFKNKLTDPKLYSNSLRERKTEESSESKKETVFLYLKPRPTSQPQGKHDQMFGQISLSLINTNDKVYSLKIQVNYYSGFQYTEPKHLKELMTFISSPDAK